RRDTRASSRRRSAFPACTTCTSSWTGTGTTPATTTHRWPTSRTWTTGGKRSFVRSNGSSRPARTTPSHARTASSRPFSSVRGSAFGPSSGPASSATTGRSGKSTSAASSEAASISCRGGAGSGFLRLRRLGAQRPQPPLRHPRLSARVARLLLRPENAEDRREGAPALRAERREARRFLRHRESLLAGAAPLEMPREGQEIDGLAARGVCDDLLEEAHRRVVHHPPRVCLHAEDEALGEGERAIAGERHAVGKQGERAVALREAGRVFAKPEEALRKKLGGFPCAARVARIRDSFEDHARLRPALERRERARERKSPGGIARG